MIDDATLAEREQAAREKDTHPYPSWDLWLLEAHAEIRRLREGHPAHDAAYHGDVASTYRRLLADLAVYRAVVRELAETLIATRARWNLDIPGYKELLAHPLVQQAREEPHA